MMTQNQDHSAAKKVFLHKNGQPKHPGKMMVVNNRQIRDFNSFLAQVTGGLKAPVAIRNIYTPINGTKVSNLDQLQPGQHYVAGGSERFRKGNYSDNSASMLIPKRRHYHPFQVPPRAQQAVIASARYKKPTEKPITIHVYRNGEERYHGARILLNKRSHLDMEKVLELVTEKTELFTPAKRLYTLDGQLVQAVTAIENRGEYVAVEGTKSFCKVLYSRDVTLNKSMSPAKRLTVPKIRHLQPLHHEGRVSDISVSPTQDDGALVRKQHNRYLRTKPPTRVPPLKAGKKFTRKERPMGGRKDKEAREIALKDTREDSVFGGSPVLSQSTHHMPSPPGSALQDPSSVISDPGRPQQQQQQQQESDVEPHIHEEDTQGEELEVTEECLKDPLEPPRESPLSGNVQVPSSDTVPEDAIEEDIEPQPTQPPELVEFQSTAVKHSVDLSVRRQDVVDDQAEDKDLVANSHSREGPLSQVSKTSIRSKSEGNLEDSSRVSVKSNISTRSSNSKKSDKLSNSSNASLKSSSLKQHGSATNSTHSVPEAEVDSEGQTTLDEEPVESEGKDVGDEEEVASEEQKEANDTDLVNEADMHIQNDSLVEDQTDDSQSQENRFNSEELKTQKMKDATSRKQTKLKRRTFIDNSSPLHFAQDRA